MDVVVVGKLTEGQELIPVILSLVDKDAEKLLQLLVDALSLTIRLWMECG